MRIHLPTGSLRWDSPRRKNRQYGWYHGRFTCLYRRYIFNCKNHLLQGYSEESTSPDHRMLIFYRRLSKGYTVWQVSSFVSQFETNFLKKHDLAQRAVVNLVSNADTMIQKFESTFRDLMIELIFGSSLQTTIVSCRILQKVENIGE